MTGQLCVLGHDRRGLAGADEEDVQHNAGMRIRPRKKPAFAPGEIEGTVRLVDEQPPAARVDEPRHWDPAAVCAKPIATLSAARIQRRSAAVELRPALAESEQRTIAEREAEG